MPLPDIFQHQGSGNSFRGLQAACICPALSKFRPNVGDGATYPPSTPQKCAKSLILFAHFQGGGGGRGALTRTELYIVG